ncbi:tandem-95 repeat protein [Geodermatophilaceae bacterium NBWT11]|nr:tandem-95 repeat protein [Geodermatophilaceae bacterium NBWT11]
MNTTRFLAGSVSAALALGVATVVAAPAASAAPLPLQCTPAGVIVSAPAGSTQSTLERLGFTTQPDGTTTVTRTPIASGLLPEVVNGIGFNTVDGRVYGVNPAGQIVRFGEDGSTGYEVLGRPTVGGTATAVSTASAAVTATGHYVFTTPRNGSTPGRIWDVDLNDPALPGTFRTITGPAGLLADGPSDVSFNPFDGQLYGIVTGQAVLYRINPATGAGAAVTVSGVAPPSSAGGSWTDSFGRMYFFDNGNASTSATSANGKIWRYDPQTGAGSIVSNAQRVQTFDATACLPPSMTKTADPGSVVDGSTITFRFQIANPSPGVISTTNFVDTLPTASGLTWETNPVTPATPGGGTVTVSGATLRIDGISVPSNAGGGPLTFTARASITGTPTAGQSENTATVDYNGTLIRSDDPDQPGATDSTPFLVRVAPATSADTATTTQDTTVAVSVLGNDTANATTLAPASVRLVDGTGALVTTLTVADEGTYTANANGTVSFDPLPTFTGPATPVTYSVADQNGDRSTATVAVTVTAAPAPTATPDTPSAAYNTPVSVVPTANDSPGATNTSFVASSVQLTDPDTGLGVSTLTVPDEGTYTVDAGTGGVTFTPLASFTGPATPVTYTAATTFGTTVTSTVTPTVGRPALPTATDDTASAPFSRPVTFTPLTDDTAGPTGTTFVTGSLTLVDPDTGNEATTVTVADEGTWQVDTATGQVTFTPLVGFSGPATPLTYRVTTNVGDTASATLSATTGAAPTADPDTGTARYDRPVTVDVLDGDVPGTGATLEADSVVLVDGAGNGVTSLVVPDAGTWTVDPVTGAVTFTPVDGFTGTVVVPYRVTDSDGNTATSTVTVVVDPPPSADDDAATTAQGTAVGIDVLTNDEGGPAGLDAGSVQFVDPATDSLVGTLTVPDQGTYTVDAEGLVTFTPLPTFSGPATPVTYSVADNQGTRTTALVTVTVTPAAAPTGRPDTPSGAYGTPIVLDPTADDDPGADGATFTPGSVRLIDPAGAAVTTLTVADEGTYTVDGDTGQVTFTPLPTFRGPATPVTYTASTTFGGTVTSTITPTTAAPGTPAATDDAGSAPSGDPVVVTPLANDTTGDPGVTFVASSLQLVDPATAAATDSVTVAGQGTWTVDTATGGVTFTPVPGFEGPATPLTYRATTTAGDVVSARITVTSGAAPVATPDSLTVPNGRTATVDVLDNDAPGTAATLLPQTLVLRDGDGDAVDTLEVPGVGTWTVSTDGRVTFVPVAGFSGSVSVPYEVTDDDGNTAGSTVTVVVAAPPVGVPDVASGPEGAPVTFRPLSNDIPSGTGATPAPTSLRLVDPATGRPTTTVTVAGQGTWTLGGDGTVVFTPVTGFTGTATPVGYTATDGDGLTVTATMTAAVTPTPPVVRDDTATGGQGRPITVDPLGNDQPGTGDLDPTSLRLVGPNGQLTTSLAVPGQGRYTVDTITGAITFTPEAAFTGTAVVQYSVADSDGTRAVATVSFTVTAPGIAQSPGPGGGVTVTLPNGSQLAVTGFDLAWQGGLALLLLVAGAVVLLAQRRRPTGGE